MKKSVPKICNLPRALALKCCDQIDNISYHSFVKKGVCIPRWKPDGHISLPWITVLEVITPEDFLELKGTNYS